MYKPYEGESLTEELLQAFTLHPGFIVSCAYLLLTIGGVLFCWAFYDHFEIPFLQLADFSDFLLSGIREPVSLATLLGGILVGAGFSRLIQYTYRQQTKWQESPGSIRRTVMLVLCYTPKLRVTVALWIFIAFLAYTWLFVVLYAGWRSEQIVSGYGNPVRVYTGDQKTRPEAVILIGSTLNYVITYHVDSGQSSITPVESIDRILPLTRPSVFED